MNEQQQLSGGVRKAEAASEPDLKILTLLNEVGVLCARAESGLNECLEKIIETAIALTGAERGNIQLLDESRTLRIAAQRGFAAPFLEFFASVGSGEAAACGAAMRSGERVVIEDVTRSPIFAGKHALEVVLEAGVWAVQSTPLRSSDGKVFGMISTHFGRPHRPRESELRLMDLLARQAADFLERRRAQELLRAKEEELEKVINGTPFMLTRCSRDLRYLFVSHAYAEMLGRKPEEIAGKPIVEIMGKEGFETILPHVERVLQGERVEYESSVAFEGVGRRWLQVIYTPEKEEGGKVAGWIASILDVTERKRAEEALRRSEEDLGQAHAELASRAVHLERLVQERTERLNEMLGDLDAFSYSIAHDLRAPLRTMQGFAGVLETECASMSSTAEDCVRWIKTGAERMDLMIRDVLAYSRTLAADLRLSPTDVGAMVRKIIEANPAFQRPQAEIELPDKLPLVNANEAALTQCVTNLLGNAIKFVAQGVTPRVRIWAAQQDGRVRLCFSDNGIGIEKEAQESVFGIFQRLSKDYEGTGIGLAIVKKAVERMGGRVGLESQPGEGSTFWLELSEVDRN